MPVYVAAMGPQNLRLTGEMADGWLGNAFIPEAAEVFLGPLREGAERAGRALTDLDLVAPVAVEIHDDEASADAGARRHADGYAFTIGAMGANGRNFYNDAFTRLGYGDEVSRSPHCGKTGNETKPARRYRSTSAGSRISLPPRVSPSACASTERRESRRCWPNWRATTRVS